MIKIYTSNHCKYCNILKEKLNDDDIEFINIDIDDEANKEESNNLFKFVGKDEIPIIIKGKHVLVPNNSFKTIDQAVEIIKSLK